MKFKKLVILFLIIVMVFTFTSCGEKSKEGKDIVAKVGDENITAEQLEQYTYLYCFIQGVDLSTATEENLEYIQKMMLEDLIALNVMKIYYKDNTSILPKDYEKSAETFLETVSKEEVAKNYMKKYGVSNEAIKDFYISQYYSVAFFDELEAELPEVKEEEIRTYFDEHQDEFKIDEITAKHILVEKKELAEEILAKLKNGADFGKLAAEYGTDGTAEKGGDLGTFGRNVMDPEFEKVAFALKPGELSDVVKTQFGYHIILVTDKNQGMESFEDVKETIKATLQNNALSKVYTEKIAELSKEIGVKNLLDKATD